ncbi:MAG TPA: addiction module protein [Coriobacteriia bacterium]|jgi:putative addiction module component (TIGR02574 family)
MTMEELKREALRLDPSNRAELARELLVSLDELPEPEIERLWLEEAVRRDEEMASGKVQPIPMDEVFAELRASRG